MDVVFVEKCSVTDKLNSFNKGLFGLGFFSVANCLCKTGTVLNFSPPELKSYIVKELESDRISLTDEDIYLLGVYNSGEESIFSFVNRWLVVSMPLFQGGIGGGNDYLSYKNYLSLLTADLYKKLEHLEANELLIPFDFLFWESGLLAFLKEEDIYNNTDKFDTLNLFILEIIKLPVEKIIFCFESTGDFNFFLNIARRMRAINYSELTNIKYIV